MTDSLECSEWITIAEQRGLMLKSRDLETLFPSGDGPLVEVLKPDYMLFVSVEHPRQYGIQYNILYDLSTMNQFKEWIGPNTKLILTEPKRKSNVDNYVVEELVHNTIENSNQFINDNDEVCTGSGMDIPDISFGVD